MTRRNLLQGLLGLPLAAPLAKVAAALAVKKASEPHAPFKPISIKEAVAAVRSQRHLKSKPMNTFEPMPIEVPPYEPQRYGLIMAFQVDSFMDNYALREVAPPWENA